MWEQLATMFDCSNMYALCKLSYLHKPLRFSDCSILLHSAFEFNMVSMSIVICLVFSKWCKCRCGVFSGGQFTLIHAVFLPGSLFVGCKPVFPGNWKAVVLSCPGLSVIAGIQMLVRLGVFIDLLVPALAVLSGLVVPVSDVRIVWYN